MTTYADLLAAAADPDDRVTRACAGVIARAALRRAPYDVPLAGLDRCSAETLRAELFPRWNAPLWREREAARDDEFADVLALLLEYRTDPDRRSEWLAHAIATAAMAENHLWQDMGLPNRAELSWIMRTHFASLARLNGGDMKWKKFIYRQLCERAGLMLCRSPSCGVCSDYAGCFETEETIRIS